MVIYPCLIYSRSLCSWDVARQALASRRLDQPRARNSPRDHYLRYGAPPGGTVTNGLPSTALYPLHVKGTCFTVFPSYRIAAASQRSSGGSSGTFTRRSASTTWTLSYDHGTGPQSPTFQHGYLSHDECCSRYHRMKTVLGKTTF